MNISNWGIAKIMRLPDWCFGVRWPLCVSPEAAAGAVGFDISESTRTDRLVIWEMTITTSLMLRQADYFRLAMGMQLPTTAVEFNELDPLFPTVGNQGPEPRQIGFFNPMGFAIRNMKFAVPIGPRRIVAEVTPTADQDGGLNIVFVCSAMPKEIPDWIVSGLDKNLL